MQVQSLLLAVIQRDDLESSIQTLTSKGFRVTCVNSIGGFLRARNVTLLIGLSRQDVPVAIRLLSETCHKRTTFVNATPSMPGMGTSQFLSPLEVEIGGATIFVLPVEQHVLIDFRHREYTFEPLERKSDASGMKMVLVIVPQELSDGVLRALTDAHYGATLISTSGGFLRKGNATLMLGIESGRVNKAVLSIEQCCMEKIPHTDTGEVAANVFVLDMAQFQIVRSVASA